MIVYTRCALKQLKCKISSLSKRCLNCVSHDKDKCESFVFIVNFFVIDKIMKKLKREKIKLKLT